MVKNLKPKKFKVLVFDLMGVLFYKTIERNTPVIKPFEWAVDFALLSKRNGLSLFWCSNMSKSSFTQLYKEYNYLFNKFTGGVLSEDVGVMKPDKAMWLALIENYNLTAETILFLDDRIDNVKAAFQLGISSLMVTNEKQTIKELENLGLYCREYGIN